MAKLYTEEEVKAMLSPLHAKITQLEEMIARLQKNSSNSSKPPSSDIIKPKPKGCRKGKRKIGAQPGHPRYERPLFSETDITEFYDYRLTACPECNNPDVIFLDRPPRIIQQMELEKIMVLKEEHRSYPVWCKSCGKIHYHPFPEHVVKEGLFKERLTALVAYIGGVGGVRSFFLTFFFWEMMKQSLSMSFPRNAKN